MSTRNLVRLLPALTLLLLLPSCGSFGRKFNQGLPEFLRSDPGADELARYRERVRVLKRTKEEADEARVAFERCRDFFDEGDYENANTALVDYLKQYPDTTDDKEARFLLIKARLGDEEWFDAQEAIRTFIATYPISDFNDQIEEITWQLANDYIDGEHDVLFFSKKGDGVTLLRDMVLNFPNGTYADDAHWRLGTWYYDEESWMESEASFAAIVENHPDSPWAGRAQYNRGLTRLAQVKGSDYDEDIMRRARDDFRHYLAQFPEGDRRSEATDHIARLDELRGQKQLSIGDWYLDQDWPSAAQFYYLKCTKLHGETQAAATARERLAELPAQRGDRKPSFDPKDDGSGPPVTEPPPSPSGAL